MFAYLGMVIFTPLLRGLETYLPNLSPTSYWTLPYYSRHRCVDLNACHDIPPNGRPKVQKRIEPVASKVREWQ